MTDFCKRLRQGLDIRGLKPVDLAERLGISRGAVSQYLSGKIAPRQDKLYQISQVLECSPAWLMGADLDMDGKPHKESVYDLLDILFRGEPEFLSKIKSIQVDGKLNEPGVAAKLTETQKETLRNIIKMTYNEAVRNGGQGETVVTEQ